jgi:hypothetical protein
MKKVIALTFGASTLFLAGCCTTHHEHAASKWEYQVVTGVGEANRMADKGWVVAGYSAVVDAGRTDYILMKRPKQ